MEADEVNAILETIADEYVIKGMLGNKFYAKVFAIVVLGNVVSYTAVMGTVGYLARKEKQQKKEN